jgi:hypothetical protein
MVSVKINGVYCGVLWTMPYKIDITKLVRSGNNDIEMEVTNTWHNRLIGDELLSPEKRVTWTTAPFRLRNNPLEPAGITGNVRIVTKIR